MKTVSKNSTQTEAAEMPRNPIVSAGGVLHAPSWGPLVEVCARYGIKRTRAFELARKGHIEHFALGRSRMVYIESVESLPTRATKHRGVR